MTTGKLGVLASAFAMVILLALPAVAAAQMVLPHVFVGTATLDGIPAAQGTQVKAMLDGQPAGSAVVEQGGKFTILVNGPGERGDLYHRQPARKGETLLDTGRSDRAGPERQRIDAKPLPVEELA